MAWIRLLILSALVASLAAGPAHAQEVETERMTWVEIRDAVAAGKTTILIPTGGTEQNGPHMVTGKHNFIVRETARRIALALGDALAAPVLAYAPEGDITKAEGHMGFPGSISVAPEIFASVLESAAHSFAIHGFKLIVFVGDSGPNQEPQRQVASNLTRRWAVDGVRVINADDYYANNGGVELLRAEGETDAVIGSHAAVRDTSELMAIYPAGVRNDRRAADKDGVSGDPRPATAKRGAQLLDLKVAAAVAEIRRAASLAAGAPQPGNTGDQDQGFWQRLTGWLFG